MFAILEFQRMGRRVGAIVGYIVKACLANKVDDRS